MLVVKNREGYAKFKVIVFSLNLKKLHIDKEKGDICLKGKIKSLYPYLGQQRWQKAEQISNTSFYSSNHHVVVYYKIISEQFQIKAIFASSSNEIATTG